MSFFEAAKILQAVENKEKSIKTLVHQTDHKVRLYNVFFMLSDNMCHMPCILGYSVSTRYLNTQNKVKQLKSAQPTNTTLFISIEVLVT